MIPTGRQAVKQEVSPAEKRRRAIAAEIADSAFAAFVASLPSDPRTRRLACERMTRLAGTQVAVDHGEGALHSALNGAVVAAAPAYRTEKPAVISAEALFVKGEE
ncbi:MAG: hypothetical protein WC972_05000 [Trueperaceae bacterium]